MNYQAFIRFLCDLFAFIGLVSFGIGLFLCLEFGVALTICGGLLFVLCMVGLKVLSIQGKPEKKR